MKNLKILLIVLTSISSYDPIVRAPRIFGTYLGSRNARTIPEITNPTIIATAINAKR